MWQKWRIWQNFAKRFEEGNDLGRRAPLKVANLAKAAKLAQMGIRRELAKGLTKANVLAQRARGKRRIWRKRRIWQTLIKGFAKDIITDDCQT